MGFTKGRLYRLTVGNYTHPKDTIFVFTGRRKSVWGYDCVVLKALAGKRKGKAFIFLEDTPYLVPYLGKDPREKLKVVLEFPDLPKVPSQKPFGAALQHLKAGCKVARKGWNGKGMYLFMPDSLTLTTKRGMYSVEDDLERCIVMKTAQNTHVAWTASQTDLLAEDWYVIH